MAHRTSLDRSITILIPNPDDTPSRKDGISPVDERLHRLHGVSIIDEACKMLECRRLLFPTAATLLHRFYHQASLKSLDIWSAAMACTVLAAKTHEVPIVLRNIIVTYWQLFQKRCATASSSSTMTNLLYREWHTQVVETESRILRQLGFVLYWIPESHPHWFVTPFVDCCGADDDDDTKKLLTEAALDLCDVACHLDVSTRFPPETIACAALWVAMLQKNEQNSLVAPASLCDALCGSQQQDGMLTVANSILGVLDESNTDVQTAQTGHVHSLALKPFNGPGTSSWELLVNKK